VPGTRRTDLVLLLVAVVWGSSYLAAKTATGSAPVLTVLFLRYGISALALVPLARGINRRELKAGLVLGLTQAAVLVLETYGVTHTSAANAGLIISLTLVLTPLFDRRGLPPRFYLAAGLCVVAVGLLMSAHGLHAPGVGDLLMLAAVIWHEMAHIDGLDERHAQEREEDLWKQFVQRSLVDSGVGLTYLQELRGRR